MSTSRAATLVVMASASAVPPMTFRDSTRIGLASPVPGRARSRAWRTGRAGGSCQPTRSSAGTARISASHHEDTAATTTPATAGTVPTGARAASFGPGFGG